MALEKNFKLIKYIIFILIILTLLTIKFVYNKLNTVSFLWILYPTIFLIEIFTGYKFIYYIDKGFVSLNEIIIINKSCAGINLLILTTFISLYILFNKKTKTYNQLAWIIPYLLFSFFFTIISNAVRISFSILFEPIRLNSSILKSSNNWIHQGIGSFVFLLSILIYYFLLTRGKSWITWIKKTIN